MKEQQPPQKSAQLDLTIKPLRAPAAPVAEADPRLETVRKARVVVATFY